MELVEFNWNPTDRQLRQFGLASCIALPLVGWIFTSSTPMHASLTGLLTGQAMPIWDVGNGSVVGGLALMGGILGLLGMVRPAMVKPVFVATSLAAYPIGLVVSQAILAAIFYVVFTPVALVFKLIGRDALQRRLDPDASGYWQVKSRTRDVRQYFRQS